MSYEEQKINREIYNNSEPQGYLGAFIEPSNLQYHPYATNDIQKRKDSIFEGSTDSQPKKKTFDIKKNNKKVGRLPKKKKEIVQGKHTNTKDDNIIIKFKTYFIKSLFYYINFIFGKYRNNETFLKKISTEQSKNYRKDFNLNWLNRKLKDVFSDKLCDKFKSEKEYNEKQINKLYEEKSIPELIKILEQTVRDMYEKFINNEVIEGFSNLDDNLNDLREVMKRDGESDSVIDKYLKCYEEKVRTFEIIFSKKKGRRPRENKKKKE